MCKHTAILCKASLVSDDQTSNIKPSTKVGCKGSFELTRNYAECNAKSGRMPRRTCAAQSYLLSLVSKCRGKPHHSSNIKRKFASEQIPGVLRLNNVMASFYL